MKLRQAAWLGLWLATLGCGSGLKVRQGVLDRDAVRRMDCIAVLPFQNYTPAPEAGDTIAQALAGQLLTSERYNALLPTETTQLLGLLGAPAQAANSPEVAKRYGELLGVQGVLIGSVSELGREDLTTRTWTAEPVVGFSARLVATDNGRVVWTSTTSNFDFQSAFAIPTAPGMIVQQAVEATVAELLDVRDEAVATRGLCAKAYAVLQRGERPDAAMVASLVESLGVSTRSDAASAAPRLATPSSSLPSMPAGSPAPAGAALPALPELGADGPTAGGEALPSLPDLGSGDSFGAVPALPEIKESPEEPPLVIGSEAPPVDASQEGASLPALPDEPAPPSDATTGQLAAAAPPPAKQPPQPLLKGLKAPQQKMLRELYRPRTYVLATVFPPNPKVKQTVLPKTKRSLDQLGALLKALPELEVRLDVHVDAPGKNITDVMLQTLAEQRADAMLTYLRDKLGVPETQLTVHAFGRSQPKKPQRGAKPNTRIEVTVLRYPPEEPHDVRAPESAATESVPADKPSKQSKQSKRAKKRGKQPRRR
ncbi:MAG: OmpA family protein [Myxococcota bacterium]